MLFAGCEIDHGLGPLGSRIQGRLIFLNPEMKPEQVESVRVIAVVRWDPDNLSLSDVVFTNRSINLSREIPEYDLPAPPATYELVAAVWKEKGRAWNYLNILGFYGFDPRDFTVGETRVELTQNQPVVQGIDILCDWSSIKSEGGR